MDKKFILKHAVMLIPICLLLIFFTHTATFWSADWIRHLGIMKLTEYPPLAPTLAQFSYSLNLHGILAILLFCILPYILILKITESDLIPAVYLYASGIPIVLMFGGFLSEAIMQILMMLVILLLKKPVKPVFLLGIFCLIFYAAFLTHRFAFPAMILALSFATWKWKLWSNGA